MYKKLLSILLCFIIVFSFASCSISDVLSDAIGENAASVLEGLITGKPIKKVITSPSIELPEAPKTHHTPLSKENYYQYSLLSNEEKALYNTICKGIETQQNYIDVEKYSLTEDNIDYMLNLVLADNPQYFWVAKFLQYSITTVEDESYITHLILFYTDGEVTDDFNDKGNFSATADREKIKQQKIHFDNLATNFLKSIPANTPEIEKERIIHDFILKTITYAEKESNLELKKENYLRIYDLYGALVDGYAVCEGYTKLFQYLCYQTGINATFVLGESENESHSWNTVEIGGKWYHVDTTWDDGSTQGTPLYSYFNLTTSQISKNHLIDDDNVAVPTANSTTHSFANTFGIAINKNFGPQNFENAVDYLMKSNTQYLILVCKGDLPNYQYVKTNFFNLNSDIQKYIKVKGYNLSFDTTYIEIDNFIYLKRK